VIQIGGQEVCTIEKLDEIIGRLRIVTFLEKILPSDHNDLVEAVKCIRDLLEVPVVPELGEKVLLIGYKETTSTTYQKLTLQPDIVGNVYKVPTGKRLLLKEFSLTCDDFFNATFNIHIGALVLTDIDFIAEITVDFGFRAYLDEGEEIYFEVRSDNPAILVKTSAMLNGILVSK